VHSSHGTFRATSPRWTSSSCSAKALYHSLCERPLFMSACVYVSLLQTCSIRTPFTEPAGRPDPHGQAQTASQKCRTSHYAVPPLPPRSFPRVYVSAGRPRPHGQAQAALQERATPSPICEFISACVFLFLSYMCVFTPSICRATCPRPPPPLDELQLF